METFLIVLYLVGFIWAILNIILFFKIWGMTNDIRDIKLFLIKSKNQQSASTQEKKVGIVDSNRNIKVGDVVINLRNGKEVTVDDIDSNGNFVCYIDNVYTSVFEPNEIATKEEYSKLEKNG